MIFQSPGAILFHLGPLTIRWYGICIAVGFLIATYFGMRLAKSRGIDTDKLVNCALASFIGGIIGARLYFVALTWQYYREHVSEILATWNGGMSIHGGIIGGAIVGALFCRRNKLSILPICDILTSVLPLAQAIGRWGNFFNSEAFGLPVPNNFPLKLFIPVANRPMRFCGMSYFHPTFLYESIWDLSLFLLLYFYVAPKLQRYPGASSLVFLAGYSLGRILIEPLRTDSIMAFGMPAPLVVSAICLTGAVIGLTQLIRAYRRP